MADKADTTIPSRRQFLAAGSVAAVIGALTDAVQNPVAAAIERHKLASAACAAAPIDEDVPPHLVVAEDQALFELAETPCATDEQFFHKLRYMVEVKKRAYGHSWAWSYAEDIMMAVELHIV